MDIGSEYEQLIIKNNIKVGSTIFYVRDNGIGIDEKYFEVIFQIFKRLHTRNKFDGGSGAGLTIAQKIVTRHQGKMWASSTLGAGSCFYFSLPSLTL